jgi:hypothetical protein
MKKKEIARFEADERVNNFMTEHDTDLSTINLYAVIKAFFLTAFNLLKVAIQKQASDTSIYAANKAILWANMAESLFKFSLRASVQAHILNNFELELSLDKPIGYFSECEDLLALRRATEQKDIMKNNLTILTELSPGDITQMESDIQVFSDARDKPDDQIKVKKALGTDPIPGLLNDIDVHKNLVGKLVYSYLPDLVAEWDERSRIGKPKGLRHISMAVHYISAESGIYLKGVTCTINDSSETIVKQSTKKGWVHFYSLTPRDWSLTSELEGYETDVQPNVGIDENHIVRLDIKLRKKGAAGEQENTTGALDLFAFAKESSEQLAGAQYIIHELTRGNATDEDGEGYEDLIAPGDYTGTLYMDGYTDLPFTFTIKAGETTTIQLYMDKITV